MLSNFLFCLKERILGSLLGGKRRKLAFSECFSTLEHLVTLPELILPPILSRNNIETPTSPAKDRVSPLGQRLFSKHLLCVNSFTLCRSKYCRRKGGTEGVHWTWGRGLVRVGAAEEGGAGVEACVNRAGRNSSGHPV